jgi:hypothetical protein
MDYLTKLLDIHNGSLILPFMNYPDILSLMKCSRRIHRIYILYKQPHSFYGIPLPKEKGIWFDIFYQRYESLEQALQSDLDIHARYHYNGMNLMEIAYMLRDSTTIKLLHRYKRTTIHKIHNYSSIYGDQAHALLLVYSDHDVKDKIQALKPYQD